MTCWFDIWGFSFWYFQFQFSGSSELVTSALTDSETQIVYFQFSYFLGLSALTDSDCLFWIFIFSGSSELVTMGGSPIPNDWQWRRGVGWTSASSPTTHKWSNDDVRILFPTIDVTARWWINPTKHFNHPIYPSHNSQVCLSHHQLVIWICI